VNPKQKFWNWFEANEAEIYDMAVSILRREVDTKAIPQLPGWKNLGRQLRRVHPGLVFEVGHVDPTVLEFLISADGNPNLIHCTKELVAQAPPLPRWKVVAFRQPEKTLDGVFKIFLDGEEREISLEEIKVTLGQLNHGRFDVNFYVPHFDKAEGADDPFIWHALDASVGEYNVMTRVGIPPGFPIEEAPVNAKPLAALQDWFGGTPFEELN
jgi:hypothetical protein